MNDHFQFERIIGFGSFSIVKLYTYLPTGKSYAVKCISQDDLLKYPDLLHSIAKEYSVLSKCNHHNIVKINTVFRDSNTIYFVLEYCSSGDLLKLILAETPLSLCKAKKIMIQLFDVIAYLHLEQDLIHGDIKPENIVFDGDMNLRLIDFGSAFYRKELSSRQLTSDTTIEQLYQNLKAKSFGQHNPGNQESHSFCLIIIGKKLAQWSIEHVSFLFQRLSWSVKSLLCRFGSRLIESTGEKSGLNTIGSGFTRIEKKREQILSSANIKRICENLTQRTDYCGTLDYMSPEMLLDGFLSIAGDLWALGCILYYMLTGFHPFTGSTDKEVVRNILTYCVSSEEQLRIHTMVPSAGIQLIKILLQPDPEERMICVKETDYGIFKQNSFFKDT